MSLIIYFCLQLYVNYLYKLLRVLLFFMLAFDFEFLTLYTLLFLFCWWLYFGYLIFIFIHTSLFTEQQKQSLLQEKPFPTITIIIPTFNEELIIKDKIENTIALDYPIDKLRILFCDGGSTDNTQKIIHFYTKNTEARKKIDLIHSPDKGKIPQLNYAISHASSDIIVISDADALLSPNALYVIQENLSQEKIGLIGLSSEPRNAIKEEAYFWNQQNRLRLAESHFYSPLYVIATCYAFRKDLIQQFPKDVIADDIYISFYAIKKGYKTRYTPEATVTELRSPTKTTELVKHKIRKTNAFLHELFRYFTPFLHAKSRWQIIFFTRFFQATLGPILSLIFVLIFVYLLFTSLTKLLPLLTFGILSLTYLLIRPDALRGFWLKLKMFLLIHVILYYCLITYLFYRQTTVYKRIR